MSCKPKRNWQDTVVKFLAVKAMLRDVKCYCGLCRRLDSYLGGMI